VKMAAKKKEKTPEETDDIEKTIDP